MVLLSDRQRPRWSQNLPETVWQVLASALQHEPAIDVPDTDPRFVHLTRWEGSLERGVFALTTGRAVDQAGRVA
jgi:hypothetical protein